MIQEVNMNIHQISSGDFISEVMCTVNQYKSDAGWILASGSDTGILSHSVFGTKGNRYSILVIEKEHLRTDYAGREGKWFLSETHTGKGNVRFDLEWAVEAAGSGCLVLCGKETPLRFNNPA